MSILFYRRPDYMEKSNEPIHATDCQRFVERAKYIERSIPLGLSFDEVIGNKTLPPCSLNDFMNYLKYVEFNAENLQFYLWYQDYTRRFEALPEHERKLSPQWIPVSNEAPDLVKTIEKEEMRKRRETSESYSTKGIVVFGGEDEDDVGSPPTRKASVLNRSLPCIISLDPVVPTVAEVTSQANLKWQPFTIQPLRDEINGVMRQYIAFTTPRELNLSHKDRAQCLHALQHTTHPSAFAPAAKIAEAALRGQSHPNFIRWSICNGNRPRVFFVRTMGVSNILIGFLIAILLTLSGASRWWRLFAALEWFVGISTMVAAYKGLCVILHHTHSRNLRPWEQGPDSEMDYTRRNSFESSANRAQVSNQTGEFDESDNKLEEIPRFQSSNMQALRPRNSMYESESWMDRYQRKPLLKKVFDKSVWTQDENLRILQDRIVLGAQFWALLITTPLTVIFVALPKGKLY